nr:hypothetical protein [Tanacetum cinerariifolium]
MNLLTEGCSANPLAQNQPFPGYSSQYASMTSEQFQQHRQEQQQAFFLWQQSQDVFGHDARPRPAGKPRPAKKTKSDATASTSGSSTSTQFGELMEQELRLKREAAKRAFEAQAEKDRTLMRLEELKFLTTCTKDLDDDDAYWIKNQKRLIKNEM